MSIPHRTPRHWPMALRAGTSFLLAAFAWTPLAYAGQDWFPPAAAQLVVPNVTFQPGQPRTLSFVIRANRLAGNFRWTAVPSANTGPIFTPQLSATTGTVSLAADQQQTVSITVTVPAGAPNPSTGFITFKLTYEPGGGQAAPSATCMVRGATGGRPEFYPSPFVLAGPAGGPAVVTYNLHSTVGTAEPYALQLSTPSNPDSFNALNRLPYTVPASPVNLPGGATIQISVPVYMPGNIYPGNLNAFNISAQSNVDVTKLSDAKGFAMASSADPDSLPTGLAATGLVKLELGHAAAGRDGPTPIPGRGLWLVPAGRLGVKVMRDTVSQMGPVDTDNNSLDDRYIGRIRPPTYSASIAVVPGFVNSASEVLDLGLLAAGTGGLMLVDLRDIVDLIGVTWETWYDLDGDGIDDRILRRLPIPGFATDVEWFRSPEGRVIALVAAADTGSTPTAIGFNPAQTVPGTGAGVYAIDVLAALDSLEGVPYQAGTLPTTGNALDLELRGGPNPDMAVADGASGVLFHRVEAVGSPATVTFTPLGDVPLSGAWGTPYARDVAWMSSGAGDSLYCAVAAAAGGVQLISAPHDQTPFLALVQKVEAPAIGLATSLFGYVGTALGTSGATLLRMPIPPELELITPIADPPYQAPIILDIGSTWTEGRPLRTGTFGAFSSSTVSLRFRGFLGGASAPDLLCADANRTLTLGTGISGVTAVGDPGRPRPTAGVELRISPNPARGATEFRVVGDWTLAGAMAPGQAVEFSVVDLQGRVVRRLASAPAGSGATSLLARVAWDGRDQQGRPAVPGRYWVRAAQRGGWTARGAFVLLR